MADKFTFPNAEQNSIRQKNKDYKDNTVGTPCHVNGG